MFNSLIDWLERAKSRIYTIFIFWFGVWFSPIIFTSLFVDQSILYEKTNLLKNEYLRQEYFDLSNFWNLVYIIGGFIFAGVMTRLMIWDFPKWFVNRAFKKEVESQIVREFEQVKQQQLLEEEKSKLAIAQLGTTKAKKETITQEKSLEVKESNMWWEDYEKFKSSEVYQYFSDLQVCLYKYDGRTYVTDEYDRVEFELSNKLTAYLDANELAIVDQGRISMTEKGRFYMKSYLNEDKTLSEIPF